MKKIQNQETSKVQVHLKLAKALSLTSTQKRCPLKNSKSFFQVEVLLEKVKSSFATSGFHNPGEKVQSAPLGTFLTILWTSGRLRLPAATTSLLLLHCLLLLLLHCLRRLLLLHPLCYFSTSTTVPAPNIQQCPPYSQITPTRCTQHCN